MMAFLYQRSLIIGGKSGGLPSETDRPGCGSTRLRRQTAAHLTHGSRVSAPGLALSGLQEISRQGSQAARTARKKFRFAARELVMLPGREWRIIYANT